MKAALVITGSEMLSGFRQDALVQPFATMLAAKGMPVCEVRMIGDDPDGLARTVKDLAADLIVVTGGLGLTPDDTTRLALASLGENQTEEPIANPVGSAPGIDLRLDGKRVVCLPGVPAEALAMIELVLAGLPDARQAMVKVPVFGLREVEIARRLGTLGERCGYLPKEMEITLVVPRESETQVREILGRHCLEEADLALTVGALLKKRGLTLATAESCTGGLIGHLITQISGSSEYFLGAVVAYSNALKEGLLGVPPEVLATHGAVSAETALAMLKGVLERTEAAVGIATTGIAGPTGGTAEKPVGTVWIAAGGRENPSVQRYQFTFTRAGNKLISAKAALNLLRVTIHDQDLHRTALA